MTIYQDHCALRLSIRIFRLVTRIPIIPYWCFLQRNRCYGWNIISTLTFHTILPLYLLRINRHHVCRFPPDPYIVHILKTKAMRKYDVYGFHMTYECNNTTRATVASLFTELRHRCMLCYFALRLWITMCQSIGYGTLCDIV